MKKYPLHEKLRACESQAITIGGFLDYIHEQGWFLAKYQGKSDYPIPLRERNEDLIGGYLGIDPKKLSREKDAMYAEIIAAQKEVQP